MERLGSLDAVFLAIETDACPMIAGQVAVFEGPAPDLAEVRRAVEQRVRGVPRCRQRVVESWHRLTRPVWVEDAGFDIARHVLHAALPEPTTEALDRFAEQVMTVHLDRGHPLWELWIVVDVGDGRWAVVGKVHHCMVDGIAGTDLVTVLLGEPHQERRPTPPAVAPSALAVTWFGITEALRSAPRHGRDAVVALLHPRATWARWRGIADGAKGLWLQPRRRGSPLNGPVGPQRRWEHTSVALAEVGEVRHAFGGSVNDVVLAATALGFRALLRSRGVVGRPDVMTLMPVSTRTQNERGLFDNRVAVTHALLPVDDDDPVRVLARLRVELAEVVSSNQAAASTRLLHSGDLVPNRVAGAIARGVVRGQRDLETVTTNVPGPQQPLSLCGRGMLEGLPFAPIAGQIRIVVAIWSYCGRLHIGVTGDGETSADVGVLVAGLDDAVRRLLAASRRCG